MNESDRKQVGRHDFFGSCMGGCGYAGMLTASVGCFQWLLRSGGGFKRGTVRVRVSGPVHMQEAIRAKAGEICDLLDQGKYEGPKNVKVMP